MEIDNIRPNSCWGTSESHWWWPESGQSSWFSVGQRGSACHIPAAGNRRTKTHVSHYWSNCSMLVSATYLSLPFSMHSLELVARRCFMRNLWHWVALRRFSWSQPPVDHWSSRVKKRNDNSYCRMQIVIRSTGREIQAQSSPFIKIVYLSIVRYFRISSVVWLSFSQINQNSLPYSNPFLRMLLKLKGTFIDFISNWFRLEAPRVESI
jgi:hypothetical protein